MPCHEIALHQHNFKVKATFTKVGTSTAREVDAIIDTGASETCVSFSIVQQLGISPSGSFIVAGTASGVGFSRPYPIEVKVEGVLYQVTSCSVLFQPARFLVVQWPRKFLTPQELKTIADQNGLPVPEANIQNSLANPNGAFTVTVYQPGAGVEQKSILIGMTFLSQFDWSFSKASQKLTIEY